MTRVLQLEENGHHPDVVGQAEASERLRRGVPAGALHGIPPLDPANHGVCIAVPAKPN